MAAKGSRKKRSSPKKPPSPIALATSDYIGNTVICTEESLTHAWAEHGVQGVDQIERAVRTPMRVRESAVPYHTNAFAFETLTEKTTQHIRVLVHYPEDADISKGDTTGQIKTVYPVDYAKPSRVGAVVYESPDSILPDPDKSK